MQAFANIGVMAAWTGLIFMAWLLVKERGMKDRELCSACVGVIFSLLIIWLIGTLIFLWTPTGFYFLFFVTPPTNQLLLIPIAVITLDFLWQASNLRD